MAKKEAKEKFSDKKNIINEKTGTPNLSNTYSQVVKDSLDQRAYAVKIPGLVKLFFVAILVIGIIILNFAIANILNRDYVILYTVLQVISVIFVLFVVHKDRNPSYVIAWTIIILAVPVAGLFIYFLWGRKSRFKEDQKKVKKIKKNMDPYFDPQIKNYANFLRKYPENRLQASFLSKQGFPVYRNTKCKYYTLGEKKFVDMFADLRNAKNFIFLEYFILADGLIWHEIENIIIKKAQEGVEVRLLFDDFGSIIKAPNDLIRRLRSHNIKVYNFNPVARYISRLYINFRNHQKCCVIDGQIGYTGGTNLADEYANLYERFGHWKDTAIRLEGDAVWGLTSMFLSMWQLESRKIEEDIAKYMPDFNKINLPIEKQGFYIPYVDGPLNNPKNPAEDIYRSIINNAKDYLYICTPYFIVDDSMVRDICRAAESGVDVRLLTPGKPDKWYAYVVTQSHYERLLESDVKILQYTPGFIHAKTIIADNHAITGCIN
ncbi:MAG: hypothetical protein GX326_05095, partial [Clostridiaceae bacterium]|nr:hypothetical protein [Clostridiaceae bacterium]